MTLFSGLAEYPSPRVRASKRNVHGLWVLIYLILAPSSRVEINIQGLGARERDRGQVIWREAEGAKAQGRCRLWGFIYAACRSVTTRRETNAYGKLQESPLWLCSTSMDFVMIFISVQYRLAEVILLYDDTHVWLELVNRAMKGWKFYFYFVFKTLGGLCLRQGGQRVFISFWLTRKYGHLLSCNDQVKATSPNTVFKLLAGLLP